MAILLQMTHSVFVLLILSVCMCSDVVCVGLFCVRATNSWALFVTMN